MSKEKNAEVKKSRTNASVKSNVDPAISGSRMERKGLVEVIGTKKCTHMVTGQSYFVAKQVSEQLVANGFAELA